MLAAVEQIRGAIETALGRHGPRRIGVVLGTSTSGMAEHERARIGRERNGAWPAGSSYRYWELGALAESVAQSIGAQGPAYTIATACSASAKVFASGRRLIEAGVCDAVIVGGADTLCRMTVSGFSSLEAVSRDLCNPFSRNRDGINIGEGAAAFLMSSDDAAVRLLGCGECSDAYHMSAPHPEGEGAYQAMRMALIDAALNPQDIAYVNLHGTGTPLNDTMEGKAVVRLFGTATPCSSTKSMTGHTLGAAGAIEAAFVWLTLHGDYNGDSHLPPHLWDGMADPDIPALALAPVGARLERRKGPVAMLSNSFAVGGNNVVLAFGTGGHA
jgi:3-oxoacyl-[acyl-carrier-protein] synthase-1